MKIHPHFCVFFLLLYILHTPLSGQITSNELKQEFGDLTTLHIIEINSSNGFQCKTLLAAGGFASYTIIGSKDTLEKAKIDLANEEATNINFIDSNDLNTANPCDLLICSRPFSEIETYEKENYTKNLIPYASKGYIIWNRDVEVPKPIEEFVRDLVRLKISGIVRPLQFQSDSKAAVVTWTTEYTSNAFKRLINRITPSSMQQTGCAVTCEMDGGRLGDNLLAYLHAKWISYKHNIPLLYKPFTYADDLLLSAIEQQHSKEYSFQHFVTLFNGKFQDGREIDNQAYSTLYEVPWFPESLLELEIFPHYKSRYFVVDWKDPGFRSEILQTIQPKVPLKFPEIPHDRIVVGVHVRMGTGYDPDHAYKVLPTKFPPHSFYIEQIARISEIFKDEPLYIYLFTDDPNPKGIADLYEVAVNKPNLQFLYREHGNLHNRNVLEDLFSITQCDCLIRGESYYSLLASKITDYMVMLTPASYKWDNEKLIIDKVNIHFGHKQKEN